MSIPHKAAMQYLITADRAVTFRLNRLSRWRAIRTFFRIVSSLGDGKFWYALIILIAAVNGMPGVICGIQLTLTGLLTLAIYKAVKGVTQRPRPGVVHAQILAGTMVLDEYSFPSGHTMHAVMFTTVAGNLVPELLPILMIFTVLVAASRIVLGLHYPTDVMLGALFGYAIGLVSLWSFSGISAAV
ncbi:MAG: phosphatase PAP2 family protein [Planctomyces sp.]|nr:phosphatase PAP2 family protein [Planctomyces sp.]